MSQVKLRKLKVILCTVFMIVGLFFGTSVQPVYAQDRILEINQIDYRGHTALMRAVNISDFDTVLKLLELGADPYVTNSRGESAIDLYLKDIEKYGESTIDVQKRYIWYAFLSMTEKKKNAERRAKWIVKRLQTSNEMQENDLSLARDRVTTLMETREKVLSRNAPIGALSSP